MGAVPFDASSEFQVLRSFTRRKSKRDGWRSSGTRDPTDARIICLSVGLGFQGPVRRTGDRIPKTALRGKAVLREWGSLRISPSACGAKTRRWRRRGAWIGRSWILVFSRKGFVATNSNLSGRDGGLPSEGQREFVATNFPLPLPRVFIP